jgi:hypothetical protein
MPTTVLGAINDVINKTADAVLNSQIFPKSADIVNTFVKASFDVADTVFTQIRDVTKPGPPPAP